MKPTNFPTQGQPNPRKIRLKVAFRPLFPTANTFSWVGICFIWETDCKKPNPTKFSANTPIILIVSLYQMGWKYVSCEFNRLNGWNLSLKDKRYVGSTFFTFAPRQEYQEYRSAFPLDATWVNRTIFNEIYTWNPALFCELAMVRAAKNLHFFFSAHVLVSPGRTVVLIKEKHHWKAYPNAGRFKVFFFCFERLLPPYCR